MCPLVKIDTRVQGARSSRWHGNPYVKKRTHPQTTFALLSVNLINGFLNSGLWANGKDQ